MNQNGKIIELCKNNIDPVSKKTMEQLGQKDGFIVADYGCLSNCGRCAHSLFVLVNGEAVYGGTFEELMGNIRGKIEKDKGR